MPLEFYAGIGKTTWPFTGKVFVIFSLEHRENACTDAFMGTQTHM